MTWRERIPDDLKPFIEKLISESHKEDAISNAEHPSKAQLWLALGILAKQVYDLELKSRYLEHALKEASPKSKSQDRLKAEAEVEKIISDIACGKITKKGTKKTKKSNIRTNF